MGYGRTCPQNETGSYRAEEIGIAAYRLNEPLAEN
jgi:hypothetical protein